MYLQSSMWVSLAIIQMHSHWWLRSVVILSNNTWIAGKRASPESDIHNGVWHLLLFCCSCDLRILFNTNLMPSTASQWTSRCVLGHIYRPWDIPLCSLVSIPGSKGRDGNERNKWIYPVAFWKVMDTIEIIHTERWGPGASRVAGCWS